MQLYHPLRIVVILLLAVCLWRTQPLLAAPTAQAVVTGIYVSDVLPAADTPGREITLFLMSDGSAGISTDYMNDEPPIVQYGSWEETDEGMITVTLTEDAEGEYDEPIIITFAVDDATLTAAEFDAAIYGEEGFSVTLVQSEEALAAVEEEAANEVVVGGVYVTDAIENEDGALLVAVLYLADDGSAQGNTNFLNGDPPAVQFGAWTEDDGSVIVIFSHRLEITADGAEQVELDEPQELTFTVGEAGELSTEGLDLYRVDRVQMSAEGEESEPLVFVSEVLPAAESPGRVISLALAENGGAALATDYMNGEDPIIELGEWSEDDDGAVTVTLSGTDEEEYDAPVEIVFELDDDVLTAVEYDEDLYGEDGLTLTLVIDDEGEAAAEEETSTETEEADTLIFQSEELPAADSPGLIITAIFDDDGTLMVSSDYQNDEDPVVEVGTWEEDGDEIVITLTGTEDEEYDEPYVIPLTVQEDGSLFADVPELFGEEGLTLYPSVEVD
jgi:uncharacterized lipoprotein NlpE involved in copper resistance